MDTELKKKNQPPSLPTTTNAPMALLLLLPKNTKHFTDLGSNDRTAGFYGMIENIDENMGRLMTKLEVGLYEKHGSNIHV